MLLWRGGWFWGCFFAFFLWDMAVGCASSKGLLLRWWAFLGVFLLYMPGW